MPAATCSARHVAVRRDLRIGAVREQQPHHLEIARLRRAQERGRAVLVEPLHREDGAGLTCCPSSAAFTFAPLSSSFLMNSR